MSPIKFSSILKFSINFSSGQVDRIINGNEDIFHAEPELIEKLQNNAVVLRLIFHNKEKIMSKKNTATRRGGSPGMR